MRKLTTILALLGCLSGFSQSLKVVDTEYIKRGTIGERMEVAISVQNVSDHTILMIAERLTNHIGSGQASYFCWNNECYGADVNILPKAIRVNPGEIVSDFLSVVDAGLSEQYATISYKFSDRDNPSDAVIYDLNYIVEEKPVNQFQFESSKIKLGEMYPNPVTDYAILEYFLNDEEADAKIIIHNVLGSIMGEYSMNYNENQLKIITHDFNPGIYFYTLYVDNKGLITRKLVIRK